MHEMLQSGKAQMMLEYEVQFMTAVATQLKFLYAQNAPLDKDVCKVYRAVLTVLDAVSDVCFVFLFFCDGHFFCSFTLTISWDKK